jgi:hypothetical protein
METFTFREQTTAPRPWGRTKPFRIAWNMWFCATFLFWAGTYPRETVSGLFGRKALAAGARRNFWTIGAEVIDSWHPDEAAHCTATFVLEEHARRVLYR